MNHSIKPHWDFATDYPEWWNWWVHNQVDCMKRYFDIVFKHSVEEMESYNPIYFVRYEDMVKDMEGPTRGILSFLLEMPDLAGTNAERRIHQFIAKKKADPKADRAYQTKTTTGIPNAHADKYTEEQMNYIKTELAHFLHFFGYTNNPDGGDNDTAFFNYEEPHPTENVNYYRFHEANKRALARVTGTDGAEKKIYEYKVNSPETCFELVVPDLNKRIQDPAKAEARKTLKLDAIEAQPYDPTPYYKLLK